MRGAGPAGGLLFIVVLLLVGWLAATQTGGVVRVLVLSAVALAVLALSVDVARRR